MTTPNFEAMTNAQLKAYARYNPQDLTALRTLFSRRDPNAPKYSFPDTEAGRAQQEEIIRQKILELEGPEAIRRSQTNATIAYYQTCIRNLLKRHADKSTPEVETQILIDTENNHYLILDVGWNGMKHVYHSFIHLDIKDDQIWIQRNMTEADLAQELVEMGIPKQKIVLGLHPPNKRPYTGYGPTDESSAQ